MCPAVGYSTPILLRVLPGSGVEARFSLQARIMSCLASALHSGAHRGAAELAQSRARFLQTVLLCHQQGSDSTAGPSISGRYQGQRPDGRQELFTSGSCHSTRVYITVPLILLSARNDRRRTAVSRSTQSQPLLSPSFTFAELHSPPHLCPSGNSVIMHRSAAWNQHLVVLRRYGRRILHNPSHRMIDLAI